MMFLFFLSFFNILSFFKSLSEGLNRVDISGCQMLDFTSYFIRFALVLEMSLKILVKKFKCSENVTFV